MGIVRLHGQKEYDDQYMTSGITITKGSESSWSFGTVRVNNIDFAKSDIRIIDHEGLPSYQGRVEFRVSGKWGTVDSQGTNAAFAR